MKVCHLALVVVALFVGALIGASQASAKNGLPSNETLSAMGLSNLRVMSDREGLAVRGMGYNGASANGKSWAAVSGYGASAGSQNGYSVHGKYKASGENESYAGIEVKQSGGSHGGGYGSGGGNGSSGSHGSSGGYGSGGGHGGKPKSIKITAFSGGSSSGHR